MISKFSWQISFISQEFDGFLQIKKHVLQVFVLFQISFYGIGKINFKHEGRFLQLSKTPQSNCSESDFFYH